MAREEGIKAQAHKLCKRKTACQRPFGTKMCESKREKGLRRREMRTGGEHCHLECVPFRRARPVQYRLNGFRKRIMPLKL